MDNQEVEHSVQALFQSWQQNRGVINAPYSSTPKPEKKPLVFLQWLLKKQ